MIIRMFEYGFRKGKENADYGGDNIKRLYFPKQKVIFFEENKNIEDSLKLMIVFGDEKEFLYEVDVMKYWEYNYKDLIEKKMYPLIPLQLFNLRKKLNYAKKKVRRWTKDKKVLTPISQFHAKSFIKKELMISLNLVIITTINVFMMT